MVHPRFNDYLQFEKRYSEHTVQAYLTDLNQLFSFLQETFNVKENIDVTRDHVRSWIVSLVQDEVSPRSVNRKLSSVKTYFKYLLKAGEVKSNPAANVTAPKIPKRLPNYVEKEQVAELLDEEFFTDDLKGKRSRLIIELFYATGMRQSELIGLRDADVDLNNFTVRVMGKGSKERIIPLDRSLKAPIEEYITERDKDLAASDEGHFFLTDKGGKLYPKFVYRLVKQFLSMVTTIDKKSPHVLRHTFATHLSNSGADINAIKELLGHASLAATQVYTHNTIEQLMDIYKQTHPKA